MQRYAVRAISCSSSVSGGGVISRIRSTVLISVPIFCRVVSDPASMARRQGRLPSVLNEINALSEINKSILASRGDLQSLLLGCANSIRAARVGHKMAPYRRARGEPFKKRTGVVHAKQNQRPSAIFVRGEIPMTTAMRCCGRMCMPGSSVASVRTTVDRQNCDAVQTSPIATTPGNAVAIRPAAMAIT